MRGALVAGLLVACGHSSNPVTADGGEADAPEIDANEGAGFRVALDALGIRDPFTAMLRDDTDQTTQAIEITEDGSHRFPLRLADGHPFTITLGSAQTCMPASPTGTVGGADATASVTCDGVIDIQSIQTMDSQTPLRYLPRFDPLIDTYGPTVFAPLLADPLTVAPLQGTSPYGTVALTPPMITWPTGTNTVPVTAEITHAPFGTHPYTMDVARKLLEEHFGKAQVQLAGAHLGGLNDNATLDTGYRGNATAISGDTVAVGMPGSALNAGIGGVQIFRRHGLHWVFEASVPPPVATTNFGATVALDGNTLVVGAPFDTTHGKAYVYERTGTIWALVATLHPTLTSSVAGGAMFGGGGIAIVKPFIVVGAPNFDTGGATADQGAAFVFRDDGTGWTEIAASPFTGAINERFGTAVAITATRMAIGAPGNPSVGGCCTVRTFHFDGTTWVADLDAITPPVGGATDFGAALALSGDLLVVGAPNETVSAKSGAGRARVYQRGGTWTLFATLDAGAAQTSAKVGFAVGFSGHHIVVGAPGHDLAAPGGGAVHYFRCISAVSCAIDEHFEVARNPTAAAKFGTSVAIDGTTFAVGAPNEDTGAADSGAVYIYR